MRILVCGSRDLFCRPAITERLVDLPPGTEIIHGGARGVDTMAHLVASELGFPVRVFYPNYARDGSRAPLERNLRMLDEKPDLVLAFWDGKSTGTLHTVDQALRRGIEYELIEPLAASYIGNRPA